MEGAASTVVFAFFLKFYARVDDIDNIESS